MNPAADPFDELAALFLTDPDPGGGAPTRPLVELLIVGHLPVRAGLWVAPYVDGLARRRGPSCLVRLDDAVPHLQVLRGGATDLAIVEECGSFRATVEQLAPRMRTWVVRAAIDLQRRDLLVAGADRVTILSSGDEAAVVAAYQIIKDLAEAAEGADQIPTIGLALLGCDEDHARRVVERLNRTTRSFIGVELELVLAMPRMDAGMVSGGYRQFVQDAVPTVTELVGWLERGMVDGEQRAAATGADSGAIDIDASDELPMPGPEPVGREARAADATDDDHRRALPVTHVADAQCAARQRDDALQPAPAARVNEDEPATDGVDGERWKRSRTVRLRPKAVTEVEAKARLDREPSREGQPVPLSEHVAGLEALPVRCPGHEHVELAVDCSGRLHLLGRHETCVRELPVVQAWAAAHAEIIAMACQGTHIASLTRPELHVFTDAPLAVADLHGSAMHLHVLAPVKVGDAVGWYAAPLNEPARS